MNPLYLVLIFSFLNIHSTSCSILFWSKKKFNFHPLERFDDESYLLLLKRLNYPEVIAYNNPNSNIPNGFEELIRGSFSAYTTNNDDLTDITTKDLSGHLMDDFSLVQKDLEESNRSDKNTLFMIISPTIARLRKREIIDGEEQEEATNPEEQKPVVYIGQSKSKTYGLIYSSSHLLWVINKTELSLGDASPDLILIDTLKDSTIRLSVTIPQDDANRKITLRFRFLKFNNYWYLTSVKVSDTLYNIAFNLTIDKDLYAPVGFSYHCSGPTVFSDTLNDAYLYLNNLQVQIEAKRSNFDDAYDCISFTTVPIWSGIFVSSLLIAVSMLSLIALGDIRTMDKFDNHKTKQLTITVNE